MISKELICWIWCVGAASESGQLCFTAILVLPLNSDFILFFNTNKIIPQIKNFFLIFTGLSTYTGDCDPGFYCPGGDSVPNPIATPCPIGLHCPMGSGLPVPCEPGSHTNLTQQSECLTCPAGFYCVPEEVIAGSYNILNNLNG